MSKILFNNILKLIKTSKNIVIVTHFNPDGDAMGSSLALHNFLLKLNKKSTVIVPNPYPEFLHWLPNNNKVVTFSNNEQKATKLLNAADCIFTLDFNNFSRLEKLGDVLKSLKKTFVLVDHHQQPDNYAKYKLHNVKACSTCELVYDLIIGVGGKKHLDKKIAACLYTGIMTDTGSFRYPGVTAKTHSILAELLKTGIVPSYIHGAIYDTYSYSRLKLVGYCLNEKLKLISDNKIGYFNLTDSELQQFNYQKGDTEGLVNYPFSIEGVLVTAMFTETPEGFVKISFRSKGKIDVNKFARKHFNGGGHINAAGGKSNDSLQHTILKFESLVKELL